MFVADTQPYAMTTLLFVGAESSSEPFSVNPVVYPEIWRHNLLNVSLIHLLIHYQVVA